MKPRPIRWALGTIAFDLDSIRESLVMHEGLHDAGEWMSIDPSVWLSIVPDEWREWARVCFDMTLEKLFDSLFDFKKRGIKSAVVLESFTQALHANVERTWRSALFIKTLKYGEPLCPLCGVCPVCIVVADKRKAPAKTLKDLCASPWYCDACKKNMHVRLESFSLEVTDPVSRMPSLLSAKTLYMRGHKNVVLAGRRSALKQGLVQFYRRQGR